VKGGPTAEGAGRAGQAKPLRRRGPPLESRRRLPAKKRPRAVKPEGRREKEGPLHGSSRRPPRRRGPLHGQAGRSSPPRVNRGHHEEADGHTDQNRRPRAIVSERRQRRSAGKNDKLEASEDEPREEGKQRRAARARGRSCSFLPPPEKLPARPQPASPQPYESAGSEKPLSKAPQPRSKDGQLPTDDVFERSTRANVGSSSTSRSKPSSIHPPSSQILHEVDQRRPHRNRGWGSTCRDRARALHEIWYASIHSPSSERGSTATVTSSFDASALPREEATAADDFQIGHASTGYGTRTPHDRRPRERRSRTTPPNTGTSSSSTCPRHELRSKPS